MTDRIEKLKSLHTALIDSRNGYQEALKDAEGKGLSPLFREMIQMRTVDADAIAALLTAQGETADTNGSFMTTVHKIVINIRALLGELDESILPGLIDGEERILGFYDEAIEAAIPGSPERPTLVRQRQALHKKIGDMKLRRDMAA